MKQQIRNFVSAAIVFAMSMAGAQAQTKLVANIPFGFQVSGEHMYAGRYTVNAEQDRMLIATRGGSALALTVPGKSKQGSASNECKLVFRRFGNRLYLSEIWSPDLDVVVTIPAPSRKTIIAQNGTPTDEPNEQIVQAMLVH